MSATQINYLHNRNALKSPKPSSCLRVIRSESLPFVGDYRTSLDLPNYTSPALSQAVASLAASLWNAADVALPRDAIALDQHPMVRGAGPKWLRYFPTFVIALADSRVAGSRE